ncbi:MAG: dipicolinate synthase subunit B [Dethiobacter sp.]|nr:dipicolinate synthase subunit B [Dethiobacter sp.]MBS3900678.1 dipicolinate synthase subunit B [Dethiobacter sp.]MBS3989272.1 dipicolinate synthase subunit B [Dethiobacter sp.]MBS3989600.1 dipicolinate synthase subunit B [Dethiobacter sp.]
MRLKGKRIGFALTGSHCTLEKVFPELERLLEEGAEVYPLISSSVDQTNSRFGEATEWKTQLVKKTGQKIITSILAAEPLGPKMMLDAYIIAPCTGNTLAKLANGITDTAVLMGAKAQLRNQKPVIMAISTNDGLGLNAKNIGTLLCTKYIYLVPFGQDSPFSKPNSLIAKMELLLPTLLAGLEGRQLQPMLINLSHEEFEYRR